MGTVDLEFVADLRRDLQLGRAVETGTYLGVTARGLAGVLPEVVTIELAPELHRRAGVALSDLPNVTLVQGHSAERLADVADTSAPTLFFLDGHWSGGATEGATDQCPVLAELDAIGGGHPDDCFIIDDARLFCSSPPPPLRAEDWPSLLEVFDAIRSRHPDHVVTLLADQVIAVPAGGKRALDAYGVRVQQGSRVHDLVFSAVNRAKTSVHVARNSRRG